MTRRRSRPPEPPRADGPALDAEAEAVLFDMDGTLVDSTAVVEAIWAGFAHRHALDLGEVLRFSHGRQTLDTVLRFLPGDDDAPAVAAALETEALDRTDGVVEVPGAAALLRALADASVAVVTSAPRELALRRLHAAGLRVHGPLVSAEDVVEGKPSAEGYRRAAALLRAEPRRCLVFEDADAGILAALASPARTVVVGTHVSEVTSGLPRIPDFTSLAVLPGRTPGSSAHRFHHP